MFYAALRDIFTRDFLDDSYLASDGYCLFRPIDGRMYYLPTERGFAAGYNQVTTTMTFTKLEETDEKIVIRVTAVYATDDTGSQAFRQAVQDGLVSDTSTYTITMVRRSAAGGLHSLKCRFRSAVLNLPCPAVSTQFSIRQELIFMSASAFTLSPDSAACTIEMTTDEYLTVTEPRRSRSK